MPPEEDYKIHYTPKRLKQGVRRVRENTGLTDGDPSYRVIEKTYVDGKVVHSEVITDYRASHPMR